MPALKTPWNPFDPEDPGPRIKVIIMPTDEEIRIGRAIGLEYPAPQAVTALLDTGSPFTIESKVFARNRKLSITNRNVPIRTIGGSSLCDEYSCSVSFPDSDLPKIGILRIRAGEFNREPYYSCLIGRDILRNWKVEFDGRAGLVAISQ